MNVTNSSQPTFSTSMPIGVPANEWVTIPIHEIDGSLTRNWKKVNSMDYLRRSGLEFPTFAVPPRMSNDSLRPSFLQYPQRRVLDYHQQRLIKTKEDVFTLMKRAISHGFTSEHALALEKNKFVSDPEMLKEKRNHFAQDAQNIWEFSTAVRNLEASEHEIFMRKCEFIKVFFIIVAGFGYILQYFLKTQYGELS